MSIIAVFEVTALTGQIKPYSVARWDVTPAQFAANRLAGVANVFELTKQSVHETITSPTVGGGSGGAPGGGSDGFYDTWDDYF